MSQTIRKKRVCRRFNTEEERKQSRKEANKLYYEKNKENARRKARFRSSKIYLEKKLKKYKVTSPGRVRKE
jgi:hypothetical protein